MHQPPSMVSAYMIWARRLLLINLLLGMKATKAILNLPHPLVRIVNQGCNINLQDIQVGSLDGCTSVLLLSVGCLAKLAPVRLGGITKPSRGGHQLSAHPKTCPPNPGKSLWHILGWQQSPDLLMSAFGWQKQHQKDLWVWTRVLFWYWPCWGQGEQT